MNKEDAFTIVKFIEDHYDIVGQDDWFDFCDMLLGIVVKSANQRGYAGSLVSAYPYMFQLGKE